MGRIRRGSRRFLSVTSPPNRIKRVAKFDGKPGRRAFRKVRSGPIGGGPIPPKRVIQRPQPPLAKVEFGFGGGSAINNVFGIIEQTSNRNAAKREQFKKEGS